MIKKASVGSPVSNQESSESVDHLNQKNRQEVNLELDGTKSGLLSPQEQSEEFSEQNSNTCADDDEFEFQRAAAHDSPKASKELQMYQSLYMQEDLSVIPEVLHDNETMSQMSEVTPRDVVSA